jgi:hypothetical protein
VNTPNYLSDQTKAATPGRNIRTPSDGEEVRIVAMDGAQETSTLHQPMSRAEAVLARVSLMSEGDYRVAYRAAANETERAQLRWARRQSRQPNASTAGRANGADA